MVTEKGSMATSTFTDEQIVKGLLERSVPKNDAEKTHLEEGAKRILSKLKQANNWNKVKDKLTAKQLLYVLEE